MELLSLQQVFWLIDWLHGCLLAEWLVVVDCFIGDRLIDWSTDWLTACLLV